MRKKEARRKYFLLLVIQAILALITFNVGISHDQQLSVHVIGLFISATFLFWNRRVSFAFLGVALLMFLGILDIVHLLDFVSLDIILFLLSMMIIVSFLERSHFFDVVMGKLLQRFQHNGKMLLIVILLLSALSAALIDEVTSILIMVALVLKITKKLKLSPVPFLLMTVFATNIGSSATVVGNPVGVIIALRGQLTFVDFLRWATPISLVCLATAIIVIQFLFRKAITQFEENLHRLDGNTLSVKNTHDLRTPTLLFLFTILGLVMHTKLEHLFGLEKNTLLIGTALAGAGIALLLAGDRARSIVENGVDWWTLVFFMFLFSSVGSLEYTGLVNEITYALGNAIGDNSLLAMGLVMGTSGILSAMLDNVLAVAVVAPIVQELVSALPAVGDGLWWSLLFGSTLFGNLTHIGSTANIVALGMLQKQGEEAITLRQWIVPGAVVAFITGIIAFVLLIIQIL